MFRLALAFACLALPALAAPPGVRQPDAVRLADFDAHLGRALRQALNSGDAEAIAVVTEVMAGADAGLSPEGNWNCRTIKLGGILPVVAYSNFRCRITAGADGGWTFEKLTGSQRTVGNLYGDTPFGGLVYLGVGHVGDAPAVLYDGLPARDQAPVEPNQTHADVGRLEVMGPGRARLLLPDPILESDFNILYLTR